MERVSCHTGVAISLIVRTGKSTLLKILGGVHMAKKYDARVLGVDAFATSLNASRIYLHSDWGSRNVTFAGYSVQYSCDIAVSEMNTSLQEQFPERAKRLRKLLGVNLNWRVHMLSQGQRRRVQLYINLLRPFDVLLLDEVTACLG
jgi:CCR4-NOT complex subunit CAF16